MPEISPRTADRIRVVVLGSLSGAAISTISVLHSPAAWELLVLGVVGFLSAAFAGRMGYRSELYPRNVKGHALHPMDSRGWLWADQLDSLQAEAGPAPEGSHLVTCLKCRTCDKGNTLVALYVGKGLLRLGCAACRQDTARIPVAYEGDVAAREPVQ